MAERESAKVRIMDAAERLIHENGFHGTSLDAILLAAGASKGAFFHHFPSKDDLGDALLTRYAEADAALLDEFLTRAEEMSDDPAEQVVSFIRLFAERAEDMATTQPGCLFVSFIYERGPRGGLEEDVITGSIELWRNKLVEKLEIAVASKPALSDIDLSSLADQVFSTFEGGFILARATNDPSHLAKQLSHLQRYFELLLGVKVPALVP